MLIIKILIRYNRFVNYLRIRKLRYMGCLVGNNCTVGRISVIGYHRIIIGDSVTIQDNVKLSATGYSTNGQQNVMHIKDQVFIGYGTVIESNKYVELNRYCMIGPYCYISDSNHVHLLNNELFQKLGGIYKGTIIKENCWIGAHSLILSGVTINENSVVAGNTTVIKDINKGTLNAGSPSIEKRKNVGK